MIEALSKVKDHIEPFEIEVVTIHGIGMFVRNKDEIYLLKDGEDWKKVEVSHEGFIL